MNLHHTPQRNRLAVETVSAVMMISINGPPLAKWKVRKYVLSWLKSGKHGANDKVTGKAETVEIMNKSAALFLL